MCVILISFMPGTRQGVQSHKLLPCLLRKWRFSYSTGLPEAFCPGQPNWIEEHTNTAQTKTGLRQDNLHLQASQWSRRIVIFVGAKEETYDIVLLACLAWSALQMFWRRVCGGVLDPRASGLQVFHGGVRDRLSSTSIARGRHST